MKIKSPWGKITTILIVLFLIALASLLALEAKADTKAELSTYTTWVGGERYDADILFISEVSMDKKYQAGFLLQTHLECSEGVSCIRGNSPRANQAVFVQRNVYYRDFYMYIGVSYWSAYTPAWNSKTPYTLGMGYQISEHMSINYRHFSTGGSSSNNGGMDMLTWGYSF